MQVSGAGSDGVRRGQRWGEGGGRMSGHAPSGAGWISIQGSDDLFFVLGRDRACSCGAVSGRELRRDARVESLSKILTT